MTRICCITIFIFSLVSCKYKNQSIVNINFTDSLLAKFSNDSVLNQNEKEIDFWRNRVPANDHDFISETKYASLLALRFGLSADIDDLLLSDTILITLDKYFNYREPSIKLSLLHNAITRHRFIEADSLLELAKKLSLRKYESASASFDVDFELGRYMLAENDLKSIADPKDFGYQFRHSKLFHYKGKVDSAIAAMKNAATLAEDNTVLKQSALSNAADLCMHNQKLQEAYDLYVESIRQGGADLHSIMGIGWIALVHDKRDTLAEKLFSLVQTKTKSPDPLFRLIQVAEQREDSIMQLKYSQEYVAATANHIYGNMYNKYLVQLYTGILNDAGKAEQLSKNEIQVRKTPQTYAWYVWTLFKNKKMDEAQWYYKKYVSGKPLEGLELYWMGKYMKALGKGYNSRQYFDKAEKNKYDLSPAMIKDLETALEE